MSPATRTAVARKDNNELPPVHSNSLAAEEMSRDYQFLPHAASDCCIAKYEDRDVCSGSKLQNHVRSSPDSGHDGKSRLSGRLQLRIVTITSSPKRSMRATQSRAMFAAEAERHVAQRPATGPGTGSQLRSHHALRPKPLRVKDFFVQKFPLHKMSPH